MRKMLHNLGIVFHKEPVKTNVLVGIAEGGESHAEGSTTIVEGGASYLMGEPMGCIVNFENEEEQPCE